MSRIGCSSSTRRTRGRSEFGRDLSRVLVSFLTELINLLNLSRVIYWHRCICYSDSNAGEGRPSHLHQLRCSEDTDKYAAAHGVAFLRRFHAAIIFRSGLRSHCWKLIGNIAVKFC